MLALRHEIVGRDSRDKFSEESGQLQNGERKCVTNVPSAGTRCSAAFPLPSLGGWAILGGDSARMATQLRKTV